jgi:elongation factor P hydroxylase
MRKQYFFKPTERGFDAWDVHRLIELSAVLPVQQISLEDIHELDTAYWFGADGEPATVRMLVRHMELAQQVDLRYPVILGAEGQLMDGMHRVARALLEGRATVSAVRFSVQPEPDFRNVRPEDLEYD